MGNEEVATGKKKMRKELGVSRLSLHSGNRAQRQAAKGALEAE